MPVTDNSKSTGIQEKQFFLKQAFYLSDCKVIHLFGLSEKALNVFKVLKFKCL